MVNTFDVYVDDIFEHVDEVRTGYPELPLYLFGHSMVYKNNIDYINYYPNCISPFHFV